MCEYVKELKFTAPKSPGIPTTDLGSGSLWMIDSTLAGPASHDFSREGSLAVSTLSPFLVQVPNPFRVGALKEDFSPTDARPIQLILQAWY